MKMMLGCDPEAFLSDINGQLKSAINKVGGSKRYPLPLMELGDGYAVQEDNVAIEFNIPPANSKDTFIDSVSKCLHYLSESMDKAYGFRIVNLSAADFPLEELQDPRAKEFGCDPDYNAWTGKPNPRPKADNEQLRSCGGHVHISYPLELAERRSIIRQCDLFLGVPSVLMDKNGGHRRKLYGGPGAYRVKPWGVEYRTLSNFWIFDKKYIGWVWDNTTKAVAAAVAQTGLQEEDHQLVQDCIRLDDKYAAEYLINKYNLDYV